MTAFASLLLLLGLITIGGGLGWLPTRRLRWSGIGERALFSVAIGMGVCGLLVLSGGLLGLLPITVWRLGLWAGAFVAAGGVLAVLVLVFRRRRELQKIRFSSFSIAACVSLLLLAVCTAVAALAPPAGLEWDSLSYHLANQKVWLQRGRIEYLPWDHHSNFPFLVQMLYLVMLGAGGTGLEQGGIGAAKLVHWLCGVLLVVSVYTFCRRHIAPNTDGTPSQRGTSAGLVAALCVATTPLVLWESTTAYVDLATALFTWLSLYALINAAQAAQAARAVPVSVAGIDTRGEVTPVPTDSNDDNAVTAEPASPAASASVPWLILSAVLMGFALGTKYTVLGFWGLCLVGVLGWNFVTTRRFDRVTIPHAALWGGISLALGLPWYVKNGIVTGNPVYPFAYSLFGGRYWSAENASQYAAEQARFGLGKSPLNLLMSAWDVTMEAALLPEHLAQTGRPFIYTEYILYGLALSPLWVGLAVALPLLLGRRRLSRPSWYCLLFVFGVGAFWFFVMQQTRYLIPALAPLAVVLAEAVTGLWDQRERWLRYPVATFVGASVLLGLSVAVGLAFTGVSTVYGNGATTPAWPVVSGQVSRKQYATQTLGGVASASFFINDTSNPNDTVVLMDEVRGFYLDRPYLWGQPDHAAGLIPWDTYQSVDDWLNDFRQKGYTFLFLGARPENAPDDGKRWRQLLSQAITDDKVTPVFEDRGVRVYRIP